VDFGSDEIAEYGRTVDFGITLGGDGTMLHYSSLFQKIVPPVISFSLGTLGFLLPFGNGLQRFVYVTRKLTKTGIDRL
jgi:NAD kinase